MTSAVQFDDIYLNLGKDKGKLRLNESGLGWKSPERGSPITFPVADLRGASWYRASRGYAVKLQLKAGGGNVILEHFKEDDFDAVSSALKSRLNIDLVKRDTALKGWNWGKADVAGSDLSFQINGTTAFELPMKYISNTNLTAKQEVSVEFSLPEEDAAGEANDGNKSDAIDQLVEMRFYIPGEAAKDDDDDEDANDGDGEKDETEPAKTAAQTFHERLKDKADVAEAAGDAIASFSDVALLTPRGRYDIDLYEASMRLRGKTYDYKVPYSSVVQLFSLPRNDETNVILVIGLDPPMRQGQTRYPYLVLQFSKQEDIEVELNLDKETYEAKYKDRLQRSYDAAAHEVVSQIFKGMTGRKVVQPSSFVTSVGQPALRCNNKANEGTLYLLDKSVLFVTKPCIFLPYSELRNVTMSRVAASVSATKTFDLTFKLKDTNLGEHSFTSIDREEQKGIETFLSAKGVKLRNNLQDEQEQLSIALGDDGDGDDVDDDDVPAIRGDSGGEDEESPDEDFVGDDDSDDDALEFDSDASISDADEEDEAEAPPRKKSKK